uniref:Profilin n=1 Tax=Oryctolagus cuniculus TaxID=9986 RepID=G1T911_RABIT
MSIMEKQRWTMKEGVCQGSNQMLPCRPEILIPCHFHVSQAVVLLICTPLQRVKAVLSLQAIQTRQWARFGFLLAPGLTTELLQVMPSDVRTLVNGFAKNPLQARREGLYFKEKDYKCVRADENSLYAKNGNTGVIVVKTHLYLLVATYTESMYPSVCVEATEKLGEYLRKKGN